MWRSRGAREVKKPSPRIVWWLIIIPLFLAALILALREAQGQ